MKKIFWLLLLTAFAGCREQKKKQAADPTQFFPVVEYIRGQVAEMDSSSATIIKIERQGSGRPDTSYLPRENFKTAASEFLQLPDISSGKLRDDYEVTNMYDDLMQAFVFTYTSTNKKHSIQKQDVIVEPNADGSNNIKTVNIDQWLNRGDSTVHKNLLWQAGKRFLIVTKVSKSGQPETIRTLEVKWQQAGRENN